MASLVSTAAKSMPDTADEYTRPFDFFGVPRELRDMIYNQPGLSDQSLYCEPKRRGLKMTVRKPSTSMLLVNRQFLREYRRSTHCHVTILAEDHIMLDATSVPQSFRRMSEVSHLEVRLMVMYEDEMDTHLSWLTACLVPGSKLRSISVDFYIDHELFWDDQLTDAAISLHANKTVATINKNGKLHRLRMYSSSDPWRKAKSLKPDITKSLLVDWKVGDKPEIELLANRVTSAYDWDHSTTAPGRFFSDDVPEASDPGNGRHKPDDSEVSDEDEDEGPAKKGPDDEHDDGDAASGAGGGNHDEQDGNEGDNGGHCDECRDKSDANPDECDKDHRSTRSKNSGRKYNDSKDSDDGGDDDADDDTPDSDCANMAAELTNTTDYFDFFSLPREIRDMIYEQPQLLAKRFYKMRPFAENYPTTAEQYEEQRPHLSQSRNLPHIMTSNPTPGSPSLMICRQPMASLLLINNQFNEEYSQSCEGRKVSISERLGGFDSTSEPPFAVKEASFFNINVGLMHHISSTFSGGTRSVENWLSKWTAQMPLLRSMDITIYTSEGPGFWRRSFPYHKCGLDGITALQYIKRLKAVTMGTPLVLVHWSEEDGPGVKLLKQFVSLARWEAKCESTRDAVSSSANSHDSYTASMDDLFDNSTARDADRKTWQEQLYDEKTYLRRNDHGVDEEDEEEVAAEQEA